MIYTFTDFGVQGPYSGLMENAVRRVAGDEPVVALMQDAPAFDVAAAGLLLAAMVPFLVPESVTIAVVDPGVGSARRGLAVLADRRWFVGPDNGLLQAVIEQSTEAQAFVIGPSHFRRASASFHGRDVFGPVGASLRLGRPVELTAIGIEQLVTTDLQGRRASIIYIDGYGNAMTGISKKLMGSRKSVQVKGGSLPLVETFSSVPVGCTMCYFNSLGLLELAVNQGSAAQVLELELGSPVDLVAAG